ncbi:MAG: hypothetical protein QM775_33655 [Pirellulales bacterium]
MKSRYDPSWEGCRVSSPEQAFEPIRDRSPHSAATEWLWSKLGDDHAWHSEQYAQLRGGKALTSLIFLAIVDGQMTPPASEPEPRYKSRQRILAQIRSSVAADGSVGNDDPELPEYPNYATSLALQCLVLAGDPQDKQLIERMTKYLVDQQYCEATGFGPEHVCYGGWGFGGVRPVGGSPGHMDIGHTRHVLQALRAAGHDDPQTYARAERFLRLLQKHPSETRRQPRPDGSPEQRAGSVSDRSPLGPDAPQDPQPPYDGGFYFSPVVLAANKGGTVEHAGQKYFASYATATCDGVLALLACGVPQEDERIKAAADWLDRHPNLHYPEGVPKNTNENWGESILFYHYAVRGRMLSGFELGGHMEERPPR